MAFTYFFRDMQTLESIRELVVPHLRTRRFIRIWDAGCAHGPEPYSLAILLKDNMGPWIFRNVRIDATDIDISNQFSEIISRGLYPYEQIRRIPGPTIASHFCKSTDPDKWEVHESLRKSIHFTRHDLIKEKPLRSGYCLIVCKNVLLHFKEQERIQVIRKFYEALEPGGFFATEQTQKLPPEVAGLFSPTISNVQLFQKKCA